jgi:hypothetical protein
MRHSQRDNPAEEILMTRSEVCAALLGEQARTMTTVWALVVFVLAGDPNHSHTVDLARFTDAQQCYDAQLASQKALYGYRDDATGLDILGYFGQKCDR